MAKNESGGLTWTPCTVALGELQPWERNPKRLSKAQAARLLASWETLGQFQTLAIGPDGEVYDGHQRLSALLKLHGPRYTVQALRSNRPLTEREREQIAVLSVTAVGSFDWDALAGWDASALTAWGLDADTLAAWNDDAANLRELLETEATDDAPGDTRLAEREVALVPRRMFHVLISVPVDGALELRAICESLVGVAGIEIEYGAN